MDCQTYRFEVVLLVQNPKRSCGSHNWLSQRLNSDSLYI
ncbi:hypothetical protein FHS18_006043, partial [Paenibacillus phyllosphaerae]|nr:hypothetical protein [Paenibacillus phyllosphaerae]